jgi:fructose-1,6-bisphosphatase II
MEGVRYTADGPTTHSIVMRSKSGTIRDVRSEHRIEKLSGYASVDFRGAHL